MRAINLIALAACTVVMAAPLQAQIIEDEGTYQRFGDTTFGPDGTQLKFGNQTFTPHGTYQTFGGTTFGSDGTTFQRFGNTTFGSNRTTSQTLGSSTFVIGPDDRHMACQRIGSQTFCN